MSENSEYYERAVYVISVAAELAGMHAQTLRMYERKGLVKPGRTGGNSRRYSERDVQMLRRIQQLTAEGLNLEGVKRVIELETEVAILKSELVRLQEENAQLVRQYRREIVPFGEVQTFTVWKRGE